MKMTKKVQKQEQGNAGIWRSCKASEANCFAAKIIDFYSFVFISVDDKRLSNTSGLSSDVYLCFRILATPHCHLFTC